MELDGHAASVSANFSCSWTGSMKYCFHLGQMRIYKLCTNSANGCISDVNSSASLSAVI